MNDFLQRLRDRKLVQWALAYVAAAFALIQVLDIVAQRFGWPEYSVRFIIIEPACRTQAPHVIRMAGFDLTGAWLLVHWRLDLT